MVLFIASEWLANLEVIPKHVFWRSLQANAWFILGMRSAIGMMGYYVTLCLIGRASTQNDFWNRIEDAVRSKLYKQYGQPA